jgi:F-type H+-transporting ATPase subunit gamma
LDKEFNITHASAVVDYIIDEYNKNEYSRVELIYTDFTSINSQMVIGMQLLPFDVRSNSSKDLTEKDILDYTFEPSVEVVFNYVARIILQNIILGSLNRARAAEHAARMMAMKTASDNAGEMINELKLWYNKARQAAITQEIAEISSGAMAMSNKEY